MPAAHTVSRRIEVDAAHRVPDHQGKCRNLHGHRYVIEAVCAGALGSDGPGRGMVIDFGFLKEEMNRVIDANCDHAIILWSGDPLIGTLTGSGEAPVLAAGESRRVASRFGPVLVVPFTPTAENLARHWFDELKPRIAARTGSAAALVEIRVWETPNSCATYPG